jgi:phosphoglycolate phosphatase-like HAD superfamily hydrolase
MSKPLVIFDFDGVLVDTVDLLEGEIRKKLAELGYDFMRDRGETLDLFEENILVALIEHGLTPHDMCVVWEHIQDVTQKADINPCPGIPAMLDRLKGRCDMAIVSSNSTDAIRSVIKRLGIESYFFKVSGGDEASGKATRIKACMDEMGVKPSRAFYVGDTVGDVSEAREAGVGSVAVAWGVHPFERLAGASPDCIMREPPELVDLIDAFSEEEESTSQD